MPRVERHGLEREGQAVGRFALAVVVPVVPPRVEQDRSAPDVHPADAVIVQLGGAASPGWYFPAACEFPEKKWAMRITLSLVGLNAPYVSYPTRTFLIGWPPTVV